MKMIQHSSIVKQAISPAQYMEWVKQVLLHQYDHVIPAKISIHLPEDGFFNTMPCYLPSQGVMGVKVVNRFTHNNPALDATIMLYDSVSGDLRAFMDGTLITTMRTGAVAATSILKLKVKQDVNKMSVMGLGVTARASVWCLLECAPKDEKYEIKLMRYKDQAELFAERFKDYKNATFNIVDSYEELIVGADIILSCITSATQQIGQDEWFKEGVVLVPVHTRGFQNCDLFFDKVFGDVTSQISHFGNFDKFKQFNEFAKVINGSVAGRENDTERILVYNIGMALHDIYIANKIEQKIDAKSVGYLEMKEALDKFYI